jgi:hypothetical protein
MLDGLFGFVHPEPKSAELSHFVKSRRNCAPWRGALRRARVGASDATERVPPVWGSSAKRGMHGSARQTALNCGTQLAARTMIVVVLSLIFDHRARLGAQSTVACGSNTRHNNARRNCPQALRPQIASFDQRGRRSTACLPNQFRGCCCASVKRRRAFSSGNRRSTGAPLLRRQT